MGACLTGHDTFLSDIHGAIAASQAQANAGHESTEGQARTRHADMLIGHVVTRFSSLGAAYTTSGDGLHYIPPSANDPDEAPACHSLVWRLSAPARRLDVTISQQTGRFWLQVARIDGPWGEAGARRYERDGLVGDLSASQIDALIHLLVDQSTW